MGLHRRLYISRFATQVVFFSFGFLFCAFFPSLRDVKYSCECTTVITVGGADFQLLFTSPFLGGGAS